MILKKKNLFNFSLTIIIGCICFSFLCNGKTYAISKLADKVVVFKSKRLLLLMSDGEILKVYKVALGKQPIGHKINKGDNRTPEGKYVLDTRNSNSRFYKSIRISYPNESDIRYSRKLGFSPGGDIMIHGLPQDLKEVGDLHRMSDWTEGCIAVTNSEIDEIWQLVPDGTSIEIRP